MLWAEDWTVWTPEVHPNLHYSILWYSHYTSMNQPTLTQNTMLCHVFFSTKNNLLPPLFTPQFFLIWESEESASDFYNFYSLKSQHWKSRPRYSGYQGTSTPENPQEQTVCHPSWKTASNVIIFRVIFFCMSTWDLVHFWFFHCLYSSPQAPLWRYRPCPLDPVPIGTGLLSGALKLSLLWAEPVLAPQPLLTWWVPQPHCPVTFPEPLKFVNNFFHAERLKTEFSNQVGSIKYWAMGYNHFPQSPPCVVLLHTAQHNDNLYCCPETLLADTFSHPELQSWSLAGEPLVCNISGG